MHPLENSALVLVDIQNDFLPGGALAVPEGDQIISVVHTLYPHFQRIYASQDWHPRKHKSFAASHDKEVGEVIDLHGIQQILWPVHCVQRTTGAAFADALDTQPIQRIFQKGMDLDCDSYSTFFDNEKRHSTGLHDFLQEEGVKVLYFAGLATDYCVKYSVLDALDLAYQVYVIEDACRGVDLQAGDVDKALKDMEARGAQVISSKAFRAK